MKTYTTDYTKVYNAESHLHAAMRHMNDGWHEQALRHITEARTLLQEYTNGTNLVEDNDVADGLVKQSDAEAAIEEARQEDILKLTIEGLYQWVDACTPSVALERPYGLDCDVTITVKKR